MRKALTLLTTLAALTACGGTTEAGGDRPGSPAVYDRIAGLTDCAQVQQEFDTAETNGGEAGTAYMKAADERMKELDCY